MLLSKKVHCGSEYGRLRRVIVASAKNMAITEVINETQRHYLHENIDPIRAQEQHRAFVHTLREEGVYVDELPLKEKLNEQVFTRDIGFTLGNDLLISQMSSQIRKKETSILKTYLTEHDLSFREATDSTIEGGDVLIDGDRVFIGISERTRLSAVKQLKKRFPHFSIYPIHLVGDILHLDCTFNIISKDEALIYRKGIKREDLEVLEMLYTLIDIDDSEQFTLGTNVLSIGDQKIISMPTNKRTNRILRGRGYHIIEVPFDEIIKSGGSFRCCSLPVIRD